MTRQRSRRDHRGPRKVGTIPQVARGQARNPFPPIQILTADQIEMIHLASLQVLEEIGMEFLDDGALDILARAGADVDRSTRRVRFDRGLIEESVARAPSTFTFHARNPENNLRVGDNWTIFCSVGSPPNASDLDNGRRPGTQQDFRNLVRLTQSLNVVDCVGGYPVEPVDVPPETRHLDCGRDFITLTDKLWYAYALGRERIADALAMVCLARGIDRDQLRREPSLFTVVNTSSPLRVDGPMLRGLMEMAENGQCVIVTPFTLAGAMAPVTIAGALTQQNAEALAVIAFQQIFAPGSPVMYGGFTSNVDMKSGAPAFGTPEYAHAALAGGQLARRYGLPYRSSNATAANGPDAQAAYEASMSTWSALLGGCNLLLHGAGWLEGGLCASFEKMIIDAELLQMMRRLFQPLQVDADTIGLDAMRDVGPGGHYFGTAHTLARYETAFYPPIISDWRNFETWQEAGSPDAAQHANRVWKSLLADYVPPPLDPAITEALDAFVARRKKEIAQAG
ncbi:trimethylamine methyltransferase family protein [Oceanibacterium hippocampi]|uniref:Methyltransferase n=1 Tax=Oceanibacterium hippocampi TaxID=745714 RepID=A0A1Y5R8I1_9PROT|nr:trimethylamine methyltransferase family protein [Oceanibacterium hippocampi]SLN11579.1 Trimethylamine methyltransferase (MTTB) [Oceanibacterium hippocampi]